MARILVANIFICLCLFSLESNAKDIIFGIQKNSLSGKFQKAIIVKKNKIFFSKNSNYFDLDFKIGEFENYDRKEVRTIREELSKIINQLSDVDNRLKIHRKSYNDLASTNKHDTNIFLNGYKVTKDSQFYFPLFKISEKYWSSKKLRSIKALDLVRDKTKSEFKYYKNGKLMKSKKLEITKECTKTIESYPVCVDDDYGSIIIK